MVNFQTILTESLAASLRFDGSVDRSQRHNVFAMLQIVKKNRSLVTFCVGFDIPKKKGAVGYIECIKKVTGKVLPWEQFFSFITSLVTDGESLNLGRLNGVVSKLKKLRGSSSSKSPLFSIWCVPHRTNLAWKSVSKIKIVEHFILRARKLSKFFRRSGKRTQGLSDVATRKNLRKPLRYPKFFAVRWVEYLYNLFYAVLRNWHTSIKYFELNVDATHQLHFWLQYDTLRFCTFLIDVLCLLKTFQKACQSDSITLIEVAKLKHNLLKELGECENTKIEGGWEELLGQKIVRIGNHLYLNDIKLKSNLNTTRQSTFTPTTRKSIIRKLIHHLESRLALDDTLVKAMAPFEKIALSTKLDDLKICHKTFVPDVDLDQFCSEYYNAAAILTDIPCRNTIESLRKIDELTPDNLHTVQLALARVSAAKPHSADVERLIC